MNSAIISEIVTQGNIHFPRETCGLVLFKEGEVSVKHCQNRITDLQMAVNNFQLDPMEIINAEREGYTIQMIYHTHCITPPVPSLADRYSCKASGYPWLIVNPSTQMFTITRPNETLPKAEVLGKEFVWGMWDCYGLVRQIYQEELSIELPDLDRGVFGAWIDEPGWNKFEENFKVAGFTKIPFSHSKGLAGNALQKYDVILLNIQNDSGNPNHCGVMMDMEMNHFYHHMANSLSAKSIYGRGWMDKTTAILRHHLLMDTENV